jgi:flagellar hook-basal body complex protein FliE
MSTSQDSLSTLKNKMDTKDLRLTRSQQHLLRNKLNDASTHLRAVNSKLGVETPPMKPKAGARPIERFMNFIGDGEDQLAAARTKIEALSKSGDQLSPADFLVIQIKMNQAQQEIDYASTLLSKVISSLTQVLNTQL